MSLHSLIAGFLGVFITIGGWFGVASTPTPLTDSNTPSTTPMTEVAASATSATTTPLSTLPTGGPWLSVLPLGDGKYVTSAPKKGYVYLCHIAAGGEGAEVNGSWIHGSTWDPGEKLAVQGDVAWPSAAYSMQISGSNRLISTNDLPTDHDTGTFPIQPTDPAYQIDKNPNSITPQSINLSLPAYPSAAKSDGCIYGMVGIMNDGVWLFDAFDAEYRDALAHELQDKWNGHPNQSGYHYHGFISEIKTIPVSTVVGYAFDGYPITGPLLPSGNYLSTSDLDECHGMTSTITLDGKQVLSYHYVLTQDFPYSVSCFHGTSHEPKPSGQGNESATAQPSGAQQQGTPGGAPPQAAINACATAVTGAGCSFVTPNGTVNGTCQTPPNTTALACVSNLYKDEI